MVAEIRDRRGFGGMWPEYLSGGTEWMGRDQSRRNGPVWPEGMVAEIGHRDRFDAMWPEYLSGGTEWMGRDQSRRNGPVCPEGMTAEIRDGRGFGGMWPRCLSGGTRVYARSQKGTMPMTVHEMSRLDPSTVELWTGQRWTRLRSIVEEHPDEVLELRFRNGESVGCTPDHRWPTRNGIIAARYLCPRHVVQTARLPDTGRAIESIPEFVAFVIGLYMAEGSRGKDGRQIQFSLHSSEQDLTERINRVADHYGAPCTVHDYGYRRHVNLHSKILTGIVDTFIVGNGSKRKHLTTAAWSMNNDWLHALLEGYLAGDGHNDGRRWRLGFTENEAWTNDMRTLAARLGASVHLKWTSHLETTTGKRHRGFRGDLRHNSCDRRCPDGEIIGIQKSKGRRFYDIMIGEPHVFTLASGMLTHDGNSSP